MSRGHKARRKQQARQEVLPELPVPAPEAPKAAELPPAQEARPASGPRACVVCGVSVSREWCESCGAAVCPGGFQIDRLLSQSPRGRLYVAHGKDGIPVALKELVFASVPSALEIDAFEREARTLSELSHPQIPRMVRFFREGSGIYLRFYLAQTYINGESLLAGLQRKRFSEQKALRVCRQVLSILIYLHERSPRVLHRDIKPANLIQSGEDIYLVDFDCARDAAQGVTHQHTVVGTFGYCPPEQLGGTVDPTSDLYALGATLLHLVSGKPPAELLGSDMRLKVPETLPVSAGTRRFLSQLIESDRAKRFPSAKAALRALAERDSLKAAPTPTSSTSSASPGKMWTYLLWGGAIALGAVLFIGMPRAIREAQGTEPIPLATVVPRTQPAPEPVQPTPAAPRSSSLPAPAPQPLTAEAPPAVRQRPRDTNGDLITPPVQLSGTFTLQSLAFKVLSLERGYAPITGRGRQLPKGRMVLAVRVEASLEGETRNSPFASEYMHKLAWFTLEKEWKGLVRVLASRADCVRCEMVSASALRIQRANGEVHQGSGDRPLVELFREEKPGKDTLLPMDLLFEVSETQVPLSLIFANGQIELIPW